VKVFLLIFTIFWGILFLTMFIYRSYFMIYALKNKTTFEDKTLWAAGAIVLLFSIHLGFLLVVCGVI